MSADEEQLLPGAVERERDREAITIPPDSDETPFEDPEHQDPMQNAPPWVQKLVQRIEGLEHRVAELEQLNALRKHD